jgi:hypothetical protein
MGRANGFKGEIISPARPRRALLARLAASWHVAQITRLGLIVGAVLSKVRLTQVARGFRLRLLTRELMGCGKLIVRL